MKYSDSTSQHGNRSRLGRYTPACGQLTAAMLAFTLSSGCSLAASFTNSPSADSFVRAAAPTLNYGGAGSLSVSGSTATNGAGMANGVADTFIRFNTAGMVAGFNTRFGPGNWAISAASLHVTESGAPANALFNRGAGRFEIRRVANDSWTEGTGSPNTPATSGIKYSDETTLLNPAVDASLGSFTNSGVDAVLSFPLALPGPFVSDLSAGGEVGLYLTAADAQTGFTFNSRSFMTNSARPYLEISAIPPPGRLAVSLAGNDLVVAGTNAAAGETYYLLNSTNAALSLNQWQPVATNVPAADGSFSLTITNAAAAAAPAQQFFILRAR